MHFSPHEKFCTESRKLPMQSFPVRAWHVNDDGRWRYDGTHKWCCWRKTCWWNGSWRRGTCIAINREWMENGALTCLLLPVLHLVQFVLFFCLFNPGVAAAINKDVAIWYPSPPYVHRSTRLWKANRLKSKSLATPEFITGSIWDFFFFIYFKCVSCELDQSSDRYSSPVLAAC